MKMLLRFAIIWLCGILLLVGSYLWYERKYSQPLGISSYENDYKLVTLMDEKKLVHTVMVVSSKSDLYIRYSIPTFFPGGRGFYTCWANESNDFFVCSGDIGAFLYMYNPEGKTWEEYSLSKRIDGGEEKYLATKRKAAWDGSIIDGPEQLYPAFYIPDKVLGYIRND